MSTNPLETSRAVESKSWDKYVEEGRKSHKRKPISTTKFKNEDKDKDPYKSPFAMAGMAFKTDQLPMKKLTVESPYKYDDKMNMVDLSSAYVNETASGAVSARHNADPKMPEHANEVYDIGWGGLSTKPPTHKKKSPNKSASPLKEPILIAAGITAVASLIGTGISAGQASAAQRRQDEKERRLERRRKLERAQDQALQATTVMGETQRSRAANVGNWMAW